LLPEKGYRQVQISNIPIMDTEGESSPNVRLDVTYATPSSPMAHQLLFAEMLIVLVSFAFMVVTFIFARVGIARSLGPLRDVARAAESIEPHHWQFDLPDSIEIQSELQPLVTALSATVDRLHGSFSQQSEFLGNAAHELKTPLAVLKSSVQVLLQRQRTPEEYGRGLEDMLEDIDRARRLVDGMMQVSRAEQPLNGRRSTKIEIAQSCASSVGQLRPMADARGVGLLLKCEAQPVVCGSAEDLELVWTNLLENAIRYARSEVIVRLKIDRSTDVAVVAVSDDGPGICQEELPHLFERFHRGDPSRSRQTGGAGLGLAVCKALVSNNRGTISVISNAGSGARFIVTFPLVEACSARP
jgi:signal transduction histidine kinase